MPSQNATVDNALGQRVGNPASQGDATDGFFLKNSTELIVFMVNDGAASFGVAATGFAVTGTCSNNAARTCFTSSQCSGGTCTPGLTARNVLNTTGAVNNNNFNPTPTATPTVTRTATATFTATATGGLGPYTYSWTSPLLLPLGASYVGPTNGPTVQIRFTQPTLLPAVITVTVADSLLQADSASVTISVAAAPPPPPTTAPPGG